MLRRSIAAGAILCAAHTAHAGFVNVDLSPHYNESFAASSFLNGTTFPTGAQIYAGVPFTIGPTLGPTGQQQNNIWHSDAAAGGAGGAATLNVIGLGIANAIRGFTLMGTWWGSTDPAVAPVVTFTFSDGSTVVTSLVGGAGIRDYNFNPTYTTTLDPSIATEVWSNGTGVSSQHYDMQTYALGAGKTLTGFSIRDPGGPGTSRSFISALTIETLDATTVIALPAAVWLLLSGLALTGWLGRARSRA